MKLFCSNAFTGESVEEVTARMQGVVAALKKAGHDPYCPVFDTHKDMLQEKGDLKGIFAYAFENIAKSDGMVAIVTSVRKSEGQLMEIGVTLAEGKPIYLFVHQSVKDEASHLPKIAAKTFIWETQDDLEHALMSL